MENVPDIPDVTEREGALTSILVTLAFFLSQITHKHRTKESPPNCATDRSAFCHLTLDDGQVMVSGHTRGHLYPVKGPATEL